MIQTVDLRVDYGDVTAVHDMNLSIPAGEVYGLIGPNGAGKTSTMKVLATLLEPTYGEVFVGGHDVWESPEQVHSVLGYMEDLPPVYEGLKVWEFLDLFAGAYGVPKTERRARVGDCLDQVELTAKRNAKAGSLSRGMTQRLVLAKTLLHQPKVLILDEPASGLDPIARMEFRDLMKRLAADGATILVSSHILTELSDFCTSVGIMEKGRLVVSGRIDDIVAKMQQQRLIVELLGEPADRSEALVGMAHVERVDYSQGIHTLDFSGDDDEASQLLAGLVHQGYQVKAFYPQRYNVEDILKRVGARQVS